MPQPNELAFEVWRDDLGRQQDLVPFVDGTELTELVTVYEEANGMQPAGGYRGIIPGRFRFGDLGWYFEGMPTTSYWQKVGQVALLGCSCGEVGCWPLYATIKTKPGGRITWNGFVNPHRRQRDYRGLGPFVFDAPSYRTAVLAAITELND